MSDVRDKAAFIWVFFSSSPDGTHEWWLLIIHAIKRYLCLLSPVSARKRKKSVTERERMKDRKQRMIKIACCCGHMHACTPVRVDTDAVSPPRIKQGHGSDTLLSPPWTNVQRYHQKYRGNQTVAEGFSPFFLCSLSCYLVRWTLPAIRICKFPVEFCRYVKIKPLFSSTASSLWMWGIKVEIKILISPLWRSCTR